MYSKRLGRLVVGLAVLVLVVIGPACQSKEPVDRAAVERAVLFTAEQDAVRFALRIDIEADDGSIARLMMVEGFMDLAHERSAFKLVADEFVANFRIIGGTLYTSLPELVDQNDEPLWLETDLGQFDDIPPLLVATHEPSGFLRAAEGTIVEAERIGSEKVRGRSADGYRLVFQADAEAPPPSGADAPSRQPIDVWIDKLGRVVRIEFAGLYTLETIDRETVWAIISMELFDYGVAVEIETPSADQLFDPLGGALSGREELDIISPPCYAENTAACRATGQELREAYVDPAACDGDITRVCFLPIGNVRVEQIEMLRAYFLQTYGLAIAVLPAVDVPLEIGAQVNESEWKIRHDLYEIFLFGNYGELMVSGARIIGLTPIDMHLGDDDVDSFVFGSKVVDPDYGQGVFGLVSTFRMNPVTFGEPPDDALWQERIRTLVTKYVGMLYYGLPSNFIDPESATYRYISGLSSLDAINKDLDVEFGAPSSLTTDYSSPAVAGGAPCSAERLETCLLALPEMKSPSVSPLACNGGGRRVCIIPMGAAQQWQIDAAVAAIAQVSGIDVRVLPAIDVPASVIDPDNGWASQTGLVDRLHEAYVSSNEDVYFLGITPIDMGRDSNLSFLFFATFSDDTGTSRWAIVPTFRLNPATYGEPADDALWAERIGKLAVKSVALTYSMLDHLPDPNSILFEGMLTLEHLDRMQLPLSLESVAH